MKNKNLELPVYIDMEDDSLIKLGKEKLTNLVYSFNEIIQKEKLIAGVYANKNWFDNYLKLEVRNSFTTWIAHYGVPENRYDGVYDILQYSESGSLSGINGSKVDMNIMYKNLIGDSGNDDNADDKKEEFEVAKTYRNGSTKENVYADSDLKTKIGTLNAYEVCECLGIVNKVYIVKYKVNGTNNYKIGFVKYSGGVK